MKEIGEIFRKEIFRVFKDKKMLLSVFVLPVVLMVGLMYLMSNVMTNMMDDIDSHKSIVYVQNEPESFRNFRGENAFDADVRGIDGAMYDRQQAETDILNGDADLLIEFPENFDAMITDYETGGEVPQVKAFYNPSEDYSSAAYSEIAQGALEVYRQTLLAGRVGNLEQLAVFTMNTDSEEMVIQDENKAGGKALGMMLPYFVTLMLFAGAMSIGTDMIAGEKERGTMASLLVSPVKRSSIIFGKVFALMSISGLSSVVSTIAMVVCMPIVSKAMTGETTSGLDMNLSIQQIVMLGVLLVAVAFLYSTIIALVSVFAKTIKEASSYIMPVYIIVLVVGIMTMYMSGEVQQSAYYIPIYNSAIVLRGILAQEVTFAQFGIACVTTLAAGLVLTGIIAKAFESEKVMAG